MIQQITLRSLQHFLYCPHRWGLMEIDRAWKENYFVVKANLLHSRVHTPGHYLSAKGAKVFTELDVWNDFYGICGKLDCLEFKNGQYTIVEYKPTKPSENVFNHDDLIQVFAQKICVDEIFHCNCEAVIYYADVKKRYRIPFEEQMDIYKDELVQLLNTMKEFMESGQIPPKKTKQKCGGCSLNDLCLPKAFNKGKGSQRKRLEELLREEE